MPLRSSDVDMDPRSINPAFWTLTLASIPFWIQCTQICTLRVMARRRLQLCLLSLPVWWLVLAP
eukprot:12890003-Prorocentrum_lima.AAC.1